MKKIMMILLICMILCGCTNQETPAQSQPKVVIQITAQYSSGVIRLQRSYTDSEKMRSVLNYFRCLSPYGSVEDPQSTESDIVVTVYFSDGSNKTYEQRDNTYLRQNDGSWQYIDPEKGQELALILGLMESDKIF